VFDLDGVLVDSESVWDAARREVVARNGGRWQADATRAMMGMSSPEWSRYNFFGKCQMSFRGEQSRQRPVRDDPGYPGRYSFRTSSGNLAIFAYSEEKWIRDVESRIRRAA